jgi:hypothetical protein
MRTIIGARVEEDGGQGGGRTDPTMFDQQRPTTTNMLSVTEYSKPCRADSTSAPPPQYNGIGYTNNHGGSWRFMEALLHVLDGIPQGGGGGAMHRNNSVFHIGCSDP